MNSLASLSIVAAAASLLAAAERRFHPRIDSDEISRGTRAGLPVALIVILLTLFSGLRTSYNDTVNYIAIFENAPTLSVYFDDLSNLNPLYNPLFTLLTSLIRTLTPDYHVFLMFCAAVSCTLFTVFIFRITALREFPLAIFLFFCLGTYVFSMAAVKQSLAMAILCPAILAARDRKWGRFLLFVAVAALIHTYALIFLLLPLLQLSRPWHGFSFMLIALSIFVLLNFEQAITSLLRYADEIGKNINESEVFDGNRMNLLRVAVYAVVPVTALLFRRRLEREMGRTQELLLHMSICSLAFMLPGLISGANLFGRIAAYFELGTICVMPWVIDTVFNRRSARVIKTVCVLCFIAFALYDLTEFAESYSAISLLTFLRGLAA